MGPGVNIDFDAHPGFSAYVLLLIFSGAVMVAVGSPLVGRQRPLYRVLNLVFGLGFLGYGVYLAFFFTGGHYVIFFKAFVLPVVLIVRSLRARPSRSSAPVPVATWAPTAATAPVADRPEAFDVWRTPVAGQPSPHPAQWGQPPAPWSTPAPEQPR